MGNMVFTPFPSQVGTRESIRPSQSRETIPMPLKPSLSAMRRYQGPISASKTAGWMRGPFLKQRSYEKCP
jgi:hypothetical protein